jgi:hypothetical protein
MIRQHKSNYGDAKFFEEVQDCDGEERYLRLRHRSTRLLKSTLRLLIIRELPGRNEEKKEISDRTVTFISVILNRMHDDFGMSLVIWAVWTDEFK